MASLPATLNYKTNPTGYLAAAGAVYAAATMLYNAHYHHGVISTPVVLAAVTAVASLLTRFIVTPVAAPRDGAGVPLVPAPLAVPLPDLPEIRQVSFPQPAGLVAISEAAAAPPAETP